LLLLAICWLWLAVAFTATRQAPWNSLWIGIAISGLSVFAALRNYRSFFGLLALIPATVTLLLLLILKFG